MQDNRSSHDVTPRLQQPELDPVELKHNAELANLELDRAWQRRRDLLANTSQELRTPLNAILSFLRLVLDGQCDSTEEARQFVQNAYDSARSLLDSINEHLNLAEIEAEMDFQLTGVNVATIFDQVEKLSRRQADQKNVPLTFRLPRSRLLVRADPANLSQVLLNLVATAIQSTAKGEVRVQARSWRDYGHVRFQVLVRGLDLHSENRQRHPHKFHQTSGSADQQSDRIGLQVAACTSLVEGMGGQIWLNRPGRGRGISVFFTLPLLTAQPLYWRRTTDRERGFAIKGPPAGPLILLVEDEPKVIDKIARILNKHGYRTAFAVTADDGLEGARRLSPALVTIDLGLPVRPLGVLHSGLDLYQALQRDPRAASLPVILITGHDPTLTQPPQELPPILSKPFRAQQLLDQVANLLAEVNLWEVQG